MTRRGRLVASTIVWLALALGACGGDGDDGGSGQPATTTGNSAAETTTSGPEAASIPESPLTVALDREYGDGAAAVEPGAISVHWYKSGPGYTALYTGEGIADLPPLCPGNSLALPDQTFDFIRNAETGPGGCEGIESNFSAVLVGDAAWLFQTAIPLTVEGQLFASISAPNSDAGVLGFVDTNPDVPSIDVDAGTFTVADGVLADGSTTLTC